MTLQEIGEQLKKEFPGENTSIDFEVWHYGKIDSKTKCRVYAYHSKARERGTGSTVDEAIDDLKRIMKSEPDASAAEVPGSSRADLDDASPPPQAEPIMKSYVDPLLDEKGEVIF